MRFLSWNVQGAFPYYTPVERIDDQLRYIDETLERPDVLALNEVNRFRDDCWLDGLAALGYNRIVHTLDWAEELGESEIPPHQDYNHVNGNLTTVHESFGEANLERSPASIREGPWENADLKDWDVNFPEKILHATLELEDETLDVWNVRAVPGSMHGEEKVKILRNTYNRIVKGCDPPCILTGDFNSPDRELADGTVVPWRNDREGEVAQLWIEAELAVLTELREEGMIDVFRDQHGYGELDVLDVSHATQTDDPLAVAPSEVKGKRFDHLIASKELKAVDCRYEQSGFACSDHAPLVATFDLQ